MTQQIMYQKCFNTRLIRQRMLFTVGILFRKCISWYPLCCRIRKTIIFNGNQFVTSGSPRTLSSTLTVFYTRETIRFLTLITFFFIKATL